MLFAMSKRGYGAEGKTFAADCNANGEQYMTEFQSVAFPEIKL